ncbi:putative hydrolase [Natranaerovirga pectinivora]|uniref:Putative hydrolase n=1 Tax=Natranaerovirga pectinivora TaxID=682400 RepID=A0A4R3MP65_9FIRM|nr:phosphatase [Natranaerovirga pectinivora]TCT14614.1 putative hydrolase [Natranaerovirga pectinivora]
MKYELDLHCHTIASGHAYSTLEENAKSASEKGLKLIGLTDHAPKMPGAPHIFYFHNLKVVPETLHGVRILKGAEVNIIDRDGSVDLDDYTLKSLDIVIASLHPPCINFGTIEENTKTIIGAIRNQRINVIGHPDDSRFPLDYELVVKEAKEHNTLLEVNNSSLDPNSFRLNSVNNCTKMLELCMKYKASIIIGSDSHISCDVGNFSNAQMVLERVGFPEDLIVNTSIDKLKKYINIDN